jgi:DNA-binding NarL/FixJ family response regulator
VKIRVLVADDHTIVREGLVSLLVEGGECEVVAQASDGVEAVERARETRPEVVVVDDGSTDRTFELLDDEFDLEPVEIAVDPAIRVMAPILGSYRSRVDNRLIVVRKVNIRTRSDAVNAGLAVASKTLVCMTDADSIFDPDALLLVARAYLRDPDRIVGIGGTIRAINGSSVTRGHLEDAPDAGCPTPGPAASALPAPPGDRPRPAVGNRSDCEPTGRVSTPRLPQVSPLRLGPPGAPSRGHGPVCRVRCGDGRAR